jgi:hypothetical protein
MEDRRAPDESWASELMLGRSWAIRGQVGMLAEVTACGRSALKRELGRCDREIAAEGEALLTGSAPILDALLWYTDWCHERELLLHRLGVDANTACRR